VYTCVYRSFLGSWLWRVGLVWIVSRCYSHDCRFLWLLSISTSFLFYFERLLEFVSQCYITDLVRLYILF